MLTKLISGGQTGVDRAALDVALDRKLDCGGWCPAGRKAEDGRIPAHYPLRETEAKTYAQRTRFNVRDSDGTLILCRGPLTGGTGLTAETAMQTGKPLLVIDLHQKLDLSRIEKWIARHKIKALNVAGPRESTQPGIYREAAALLRRLVDRVVFPKTARGARRRSEIPTSVLKALHAGEREAANLVESLAIDFRKLLAAALPAVSIPSDVDLSPKAPITQRMAVVADHIWEQTGVTRLQEITFHPSDTVRGWACYVVALEESFSLAQRLNAIRPLADDPHFGVREWAWLAVRPRVAAELAPAMRQFKTWVKHPAPNIRRFAIETTRPRGVWCAHLTALKERPQEALALLDPVKSDPARYVQDSVANWLNDASKTRPDWVRDLCKRWQRESPTAETARICQRALRSLQ
jgi:3-methyladenine DNA glycosylase AlkC